MCLTNRVCDRRLRDASSLLGLRVPSAGDVLHPRQMLILFLMGMDSLAVFSNSAIGKIAVKRAGTLFRKAPKGWSRLDERRSIALPCPHKFLFLLALVRVPHNGVTFPPAMACCILQGGVHPFAEVRGT